MLNGIDAIFRTTCTGQLPVHTVDEVCKKTWWWMDDYNHHQSHESLGDLPPVLFFFLSLGWP
ncbi:MAG TPA: transposase [Candidatus Sphingobacterium stercoripullorum]|uniref:Transposase n=1 Tax=Candidatus Sphingobacterium stercoripullorum TaxID=2838759 RepID=A0A9D2AYK3_9SPHI|nr:transposase [Candidatus Sphingobacterium stercoripullorum]